MVAIRNRSDGRRGPVGPGMTPEVESILEGIGWDFARLCLPVQAAVWTKVFRDAGEGIAASRITTSPQESKALSRRVDAILRMAKGLVEHLQQLPDPVRQNINVGATSFAELKEMHSRNAVDFPDRITWTLDELSDLIPGIAATQRRLKLHGTKAKRGGQRNEVAFTIAKAVAEIYALGLGIRPSVGRRADVPGLSGRYARTVEKVYSAMGLSVVDAHDQCKEAVERYDAGQMDGLLLVRCPLTRDLVKVSLEEQT